MCGRCGVALTVAGLVVTLEVSHFVVASQGGVHDLVVASHGGVHDLFVALHGGVHVFVVASHGGRVSALAVPGAATSTNPQSATDPMTAAS